MDSEDKRKLDKILKIVEEDHILIKKVRSVQRNAQTMKAIYWTIIICSILGVFYFIKPYLETLTGLYSGIRGSNTEEQSSGYTLPEIKQIQDLLKDL